MNKKTFIFVLLIIVSHAFSTVNRYRRGNLVIENIPEIPEIFMTRLMLYRNVRSALFRGWLPDDQGILIRTRFGNTNQIHSVESPKGARQQLTFFEDPVDYAYVCPDRERPLFLFTKDSAGNEIAQIYNYNLRTNEYRLLSDGVSRHRSLVWSHRGDIFAFASTMRNKRDFDIYIGTLAGIKSFRRIVEEGGYWLAVDFSPDNQRLLVEKYVSSTESYYYIVNIKTRDIEQINPTEQKISYGSARWSRDGKGIYITSDEFGDFLQLLYYDLDSEKFEVLTKQIPWDIKEFELSASGNTIAFISNENGWSRLYFMDAKTRNITQARLPDGKISNLNFKPHGEELGFVLNTPTSPSDVYSINLKKNTLIRWTYSEVGNLDTSAFVQPRLVHYPTFDSIDGRPRIIPAFYYKPTRNKPPYPVLIYCHGGPSSQYDPYFSTTVQFIANELGIAYIAPNFRGSSGYGKKYLKLDDFYNREDAVRDIGALLDWIEQQPELDASRVCITGGSYGGYMVLTSMTHYGDRLRCGIDSWGISNFVTFLENTGEYRQDVRRTEYGDERNPEMRKFLNEISPLTNAYKIKKPMFVVQGLHDPRVPVTEAEQIIEAIRKNRVDVWYLLAEDEGHGFSKKSNWDFYRAASALFLERYLLE